MVLSIRVLEFGATTSKIEFHTGVFLFSTPTYTISNQLLSAILNNTDFKISAKGLPVDQFMKVLHKKEDLIFLDLLSRSGYNISIEFKGNVWMATLHGEEVDGREAMPQITILNEILKNANYPITDIDHIGTEWLSQLAKEKQIIPSIDSSFLDRLQKELKKRKK